MVGGAVVDGRGQVVGQARVVGAHAVILAYGRHVSGGSAFDILVAGGGSAGCVLAARLSEARAQGLPGRGRARLRAVRGGRWPDDMLDARGLAFSHAWETEREDRSQLRARIIGGCSAHNACVVLPGAPADYDEWGDGWSHAAIEPYLERAERELRVRRFAAEELSPWHRAFADAAGERRDRAPGQRASAPCAGTPRSPTSTRRAGATESDDRRRHARRPRAAGRRSRGRRGDGARAMRARTVVLAAGAYGSPGILLRSGSVRRGLPVGEGLIDHVGVGFGFEATERLQRETAEFERARPLYMAQVTIEARSSACAEGVCDLFMFPALDPPGPRGLRDQRRRLRHEAAVARHRAADVARPARAAGRSTTASSRRRAMSRCSSSGVEALRAARGARSRRATTPAARCARGRGRRERHVRAAARGFFHPVGTCAIGRVVDGDGRVLGYDGLSRRRRVDHADDPACEHEPVDVAVAERVAERMLAQVGTTTVS